MNTRKRATTLPPLATQSQSDNVSLALNETDSSEDELVEQHQTHDVEDARSVVGVSIGREQSRLTSPKTPSLEKSQAIEHGGSFFNDVVNSNLPGTTTTNVPPSNHSIDSVKAHRDRPQPDRILEEDTATTTTTGSSDKELAHLPSPWRAKPRTFERTEQSKSLLRDGLLSRRRASSGPESTLDSIQKALMSLPKRLSISPFLASDHRQAESPSRSHANATQKSSIRANHPPNDTDVRSADSKSRDQSLRPTAYRTASHLRRSASDHSLRLSSTLSRTSSLGDDDRFVNVQGQINSRMRAIRDSWQDSSLRLPSISSLRVDLFGERDQSQDGRQGPFMNGKAATPAPIDPFTRQPYHSAKMAASDIGGDRDAPHPHLNRALSQLEGDVIVLGGYRGSILRSSQPPHKQLWVPIKVGLNLRKVDLEVGIEASDDENAPEDVIPGGMLTHIGPVDISRRLFKRLRTCDNARDGKLRVHDYGYDWRLNPNLLSKQLCRFLKDLPCNQPTVPKEKRGATVIAHSLGGLITRHAVNSRPDLFRGVVYAGVPHTCVNILGPLRNGDDVMLSSRVLTAQVNFTIRTSFALLPLDGRCFVDKHTRQEYPVDFFDPKTWVDYKLSPCVARALPSLKSSEPSGITGYVSSVAKALPSLPLHGRKNSIPKWKEGDGSAKATSVGGIAEPDMLRGSSKQEVQNAEGERYLAPTVSTTVSIPPEDAYAYLTRTLESVKRFKEQLAFRPEHAKDNRYPPVAVIYGKNTPTVVGAKVDGRDGIKRADAYDELAFASGDGVVLAKAAMAPDGYTVAKGGIVSSERGHVALLGDLEAVGRCLNAVLADRRKGIGCNS